jgi:hypothetical protein
MTNMRVAADVTHGRERAYVNARSARKKFIHVQQDTRPDG